MNRMCNLAAGLVLGVAAVPCLGAAAQGATDGLYACASEPDDAARLACYDAAVAELQAAETTGDVVTFTTEEITDARRDGFGRQTDGAGETAAASAAVAAAAAVAEAEPDEVTAAIVSLGETRDGKLVVTLDNGQVWQQTDNTRVTVSRKAPPETATVRKAAMGSYRVKLGRARPFRARRID